MKRCVRCQIEKPDPEFNQSRKNKDGLHSYCRECQKEHYRSNLERHLANVRKTSEARRARMREIVFTAMANGCVDCGIADIRVLEFDHVRGEKLDSVGQMVRRGRSVELLRAEIDKCEVRCRNCHVIATFTRLGRSWHDDYLTG